MEIAVIDREKTQKDAQSIVDHAKTFEIINAEDYLRSGSLAVAITDMIRNIKETHRPVIDHWSKKHKEAIAEMNADLLPLEGVKVIMESKRIDYRRKEEEIRAKEQIRLQEEAKKRAEDLALLEAEQADLSGQRDAADRIIDTPITAAPVFLPSAAPKTQGQVIRKYPSFRIVDANLIPRQYLIPDEQAIGKVVKALKERHSIPGIEMFWGESESFRRS